RHAAKLVTPSGSAGTGIGYPRCTKPELRVYAEHRGASIRRKVAARPRSSYRPVRIPRSRPGPFSTRQGARLVPPRMLRVLHITDYLASGGAEVLVERLVELQRNRGHDARLFTSEDVRGHRRTPLSYISNGRACRALRAYLRGFEPQVIHLHNWYHELSP